MNSDMNSVSSITNSEEGANSGQQQDKETESKIKSLKCESPNWNTSKAKENESLSAHGEVDTRLISLNPSSHQNTPSMSITKNDDISVRGNENRKRSMPSDWVDSNINLIKRSRLEDVIVLDSSDDSDCESHHNEEQRTPWLKLSNIESSSTRVKDNHSNVRTSKDLSEENDLNASKSPIGTKSNNVIIDLLDSDDEENDTTSDIYKNQPQQDLNKYQYIDLTVNDSDRGEENNISKPKSIEKVTHHLPDNQSKRDLDVILLDDSDTDEESHRLANSSSENNASLESVSGDGDTVDNNRAGSLSDTKICSNTHNNLAQSNCIRPPADECAEDENIDDRLAENNETFTKKVSLAEISQSTGQTKSDAVSMSVIQNGLKHQAQGEQHGKEPQSAAKIDIPSLQSNPDTTEKETVIGKFTTDSPQSTSFISKPFNSSTSRMAPKKATSTTTTLPRFKLWQHKSIMPQNGQHNEKIQSKNVFGTRCHQDAQNLLESRDFSNNPRILPIEAKDRSHCTSFFYYIAKSYYFDTKEKKRIICLYCNSFSTTLNWYNSKLSKHILRCSKVPKDEKEAFRILEGETKLSSTQFNRKDVINRIRYRMGVNKDGENSKVKSHDDEWNTMSVSDSPKDSSHFKDNITSQSHQKEPLLRRSRSTRIPNYTSGDDNSFSSLSTATDPFADFESHDQMIHQSYKAHTSKTGFPSRWITVQNYSTGKYSEVHMNAPFLLMKYLNIMFFCFEGSFFDFKITTGPSSIPNAGNGAFIELVRVRKSSEADERSRIFESLAITQLVLTAKIDDRNIIVRLGPSSIHDLDYDSKEAMIKEHMPSFCSRDEGNGSIFLGKYGPFFKEDIKSDFLYDIKNLVFDFEPSVWSYGLQSKSDDKESLEADEDMYVLDITSDTTGLVHSEARKHIPMYVNEVGNNRALRPNVTPRDEITDDEVGVSYYFFTDRPINVGEKHELLVDYQGTYEETRERQGYGKSGVGSDMDDESARIRRNMSSRLAVEVSIRANSHAKIVDCLRDMESMTRAIIQSTDDSLNRVKKSTFSPLSDVEIRMWIARFRLNWIFDLFIKLRPLLGEDIKTNLNKMKLIPCKSFLTLAQTNEKLLRAYKHELLEENVFLASKGQFLVQPMDRGLFCPIARDIVKRISDDLSLKLKTNQIFGTDVAREVLKVALDAATEVRRIVEMKMDRDKSCQMLRRLGFEVDDENSAHHTLTCSMPHFLVDGPPSLKRIDEKGDSVRVRWIKQNADKNPEIDLEWYLQFQVVKVVHILATTCFVGIEKYGYSLANLCRKVGVSYEMARKIVVMVMTEPYGEAFQLFASIYDDIDIRSNNKKNIQRTVASKSTGKKGMDSFCYSDGLFSRYWKVDKLSNSS